MDDQNNKTDDILALEKFLPYRLNRAAEKVSQRFAQEYKKRYGLTRPEWRTFATIGQFGVITAREICNHSPDAQNQSLARSICFGKTPLD